MPKKCIISQASVFTDELIAINDALDVALNNMNHNFIFSDSLSALQRLQTQKINIKTNPYILQIKEKYNRFRQKNPNINNIEFYWIPSHRGIRGNEEADSLAKSAAISNSNLDIYNLPFTDYYEMLKKRATIHSTQTIIYEGKEKRKTYFQLYYSNKKTPWFDFKNFSRKFIVTINRMRANHYSLAASLHHVRIIDNPKCKCGQDIENLNHVIWNCNLYDSQRQELIKNLKKLKFQLPLNIESLIAEPHIKACQIIFKFLESCNLCI